jgi:hypothetical protein
MASSSRGFRVSVQAFLALIILGLSFWLYHSITGPYDAEERRQMLTQETRRHMDGIRKAMIRYQTVHGRYPSSLDSLGTFVKQDAILQNGAGTLFGPGFNPDSLPYSPRSGKPFELIVTDTAGVETYLLKDPDSNDHIGTLTANVSRINAASWE